MKDENGNELIGVIDVGGALVPRRRLAEFVPDMRRFERCLDEAKRLDADMTENGGCVPEYVGGWSDRYRGEIVATLNDLAALHNRMGADLLAELDARQQPGAGHA